MSDLSLKNIVGQIEKDFLKKPGQVSVLGHGETSQAYSFEIGNNKFVFRISKQVSGFFKEMVIYEKYLELRKIMPKTFYIGKFANNYYYSITQRCSGVIMDDLNENNLNGTLSKFVELVHSYHLISVAKSTGFGDIDEKGNGAFSSWKDYLLNQTQVITPYWTKKEFLFYKKRLNKTVNNTPLSRSIIHGDLGFNNVLINKDKITGIIDWNDAKYGDFVYDIAYLYFWSKSIDHMKLFYDYYVNNNQLNLRNYRNRMRCYTIHLSINLLNYFAKTKQKKMFDFTKGRLDEILTLVLN